MNHPPACPWRTFATTTLLLCLFTSQVGCESSWPRTSPRITQVPPGATVPFSLSRGVPVVEAMINGQGPYRLMLDTGAMAVTLSLQLANDLQLPRGSVPGSRFVYTAGGAGVSEVRHVQSLTLGEAKFADLEVAVQEINPRLASEAGIDGLLGLRLFYDTLLTIDFPLRRLQLQTDQTLPADASHTVAADFSDGQRVAVPIHLGSHTGWAIVDTGTTMGITLSKGLAGRLDFETEPAVVGQGVSPTGGFELQMGRLAMPVMIAGHTIDHPMVALTPQAMTYLYRSSSPDQQPPVQHDTLLGVEFLKHFAVTIDQKTRRVRLHRAVDRPVRL